MKVSPSLVVFMLTMHAFFPTWAQGSPVTEELSGRVVIRANGEPARGTLIWIHEAKGDKQYNVLQDSTGNFRISLPEGYYFVFVANLGLAPYAKEVWVQKGKPIKLDVGLEPDFEIMQDTKTR